MKKLLAIVLSLCYCFLAMAQVGTWRNYLAYHDVQSICKANDNLFVLASNDLYQYNLNLIIFLFNIIQFFIIEIINNNNY